MAKRLKRRAKKAGAATPAFFFAVGRPCGLSTPSGPPGLANGHTENDEPQPQVVVALGLRITNCEPYKLSV